MSRQTNLSNYTNGSRVFASGSHYLDVHYPASNLVISRVPLSNKKDVSTAAVAAIKALKTGKILLLANRLQYLFQSKTEFEKIWGHSRDDNVGTRVKSTV